MLSRTMNRKRSILLALGLGTLAALSACGGGKPAGPATEAPAATQSSGGTTSTQTPEPSRTPRPTATERPTTTPKPTTTPNPTQVPASTQAASQPAAATTQAPSSSSASTWQQVSTGVNAQLQSVSCPSAMLCLAAGGDNTMLKSTDGGATWSPRPISVPPSEIKQVYCESESKCLALFDDPVLMTGGVLDTSDGGETWTQTESWDASRPPIDRISCVATGTCYGIADTGMVKRAGTDLHWHGTIPNLVPPPPPARYLVDLACPSEQLCIALGQPRAGDEAVIVRATNGGSDAARVTNLSQDVQGTNLETITCQNDKTCFAAGIGGVIIRTDDGGSTWTRLSWTPPSTQGLFGLKSISCPSASVCVMVGGNFVSGQCCGAIIRTTDGGNTWTNEKLDLPALLWSVSCTTETDCVAVGDNGLIVTMSAGPLASLPTATVAAPSGDLIANAVMAGGFRGFVPTGVTDTFPPEWKEIHTVVTAPQAPSGTRFKIVWTAVDVGSAASPNTKMTELSDTWSGPENHDYYFLPSGNLAEGSYKVDLYVDDKLDRTLNFLVRKGASPPAVNLTPSPVGSCPPAPTQTAQSAIVQSVTTAKDSDATTKAPINPTTIFGPGDKLHAVTKFVNAPDNTKFKVIWFATDVGDAAPSCNYEFATYELTTSGSNYLDFTYQMPHGLPIGLYRVEIYVDDQFAMAQDFKVQ